ncbi:MAG: hypothetical protein LBP76_06230 [Treponema sp.]|nr:hypothetical protein [Treponema sp.]
MMSTKELSRLTVIKGAINGAYTVKQAAKTLGMSTRPGGSGRLCRRLVPEIRPDRRRRPDAGSGGYPGGNGDALPKEPPAYAPNLSRKMISNPCFTREKDHEPREQGRSYPDFPDYS